MISFDVALAKLLESADPVGTERVPIDDACGRVLAEDVAATSPLPAFDYSAMDGYAVAAAELRGDGPWDLEVRGESKAGGDPPDLAPGTTCRIFTGARLPRGADAVEMQEEVERLGDVASFRRPVRSGQHVRRRGEDLRAGAMALRAGTRLGPGHVALAAGLDRSELAVARRPLVTILSTGDELRPPGAIGHARSTAIPESNGYFVAAASRGAGAIARMAPYVADDVEAATRAVDQALRGSDLLVTIGGVSVGDHDVMKAAFEAAGVTLDFWRVKIKPGKPLAVGRRGAAHVLGLPGNPASASLTFFLFGLPLLRSLQRDAAPIPSRERLAVRGGVRRQAGREEFLRCVIEREHGVRVARILPNQASGAVTSFADATALAVVPENVSLVGDGDELEVIRL